MGVAAVVLLAVVGWGFLLARQMAIRDTRERALFLAESAAGLLDGMLFRLTGTVAGLADALSAGDLDFSYTQMLRLQENVIRDHPGIFGVGVVLAPQISLPRTWPGPALYSFRKQDGTMGFHELGADDGDFRLKDWYRLVEERREATWTKPYWWGEVLMVTYAYPLWQEIDDEREFAGVVTCDITLDWLDEELADLPIGENSYAMLLDRQGMYVAHPMKELILNKTIFEVAEERRDPALAERGRRIIAGQRGIEEHTIFITESQGWLAYMRLEAADWIFAAALSHDSLRREINRIARQQILVGFLGLVALAGALLWIARTITRPVEELSVASRELAEGHLDVPLSVSPGGDEVAELGRVLERMRQEINRRMQELAESTAQRTRMESELLIARNIQLDLVPQTFPPLPERPELELFAKLMPAREVGGDYYDFFPLDAEHLVIVVADVAEKGVPAALFMSATRSLVRAFFHSKPTPSAASVIQQLNLELSAENSKSMFVTIFCGVLHLTTRRFVFVNAGHNLPLVLHPDGTSEWIQDARGPAAGAWAGACYSQGERVLLPDEVLVLYTDGITEAENNRGEFFGEVALVNRARSLLQKDCSCEEIVREILSDVSAYSQAGGGGDDCTLLALRLHRTETSSPNMPAEFSSPLWHEEVPKDLGALLRALDSLERKLIESGAGADRIYQARLVLEELGTNAIKAHERQGDTSERVRGEGRIRASYYDCEKAAQMVVEEDGSAFDPWHDAPAFDPRQPGNERSGGGVGLHLLRSLSEHVEYSRQDGWNRICVFFSG